MTTDTYVITPETHDWPEGFNKCHLSPEEAKLEYMGDFSLMNTKIVSVIGSRKASAEDMRNAYDIVERLVNVGYTIASGLAEGIDTAAHWTAIDKIGGKTVAFIANGLTQYHPKKNMELQRRIARDHLLIAMGYINGRWQWSSKHKMNLLIRNRLMASVSRAVIVIQAKSQRSGTMANVRFARKIGVPVFFHKGVNINVEEHERLGDLPAAEYIWESIYADNEMRKSRK